MWLHQRPSSTRREQRWDDPQTVSRHLLLLHATHRCNETLFWTLCWQPYHAGFWFSKLFIFLCWFDFGSIWNVSNWDKQNSVHILKLYLGEEGRNRFSLFGLFALQTEDQNLPSSLYAVKDMTFSGLSIESSDSIKEENCLKIDHFWPLLDKLLLLSSHVTGNGSKQSHDFTPLKAQFAALMKMSYGQGE